MAYDGTTPLQPLIAELIGCSPKNQSKIAEVTKKAKLALGITSKARRLPTETKIQIYDYLVEIYSQANDTPVEIISQSNTTEILKLETPQQAPIEIKVQNRKDVEIISHYDKSEPVELYSHTANFDNLRVAFYTVRNNKRERQVISLDGYLINALASIKVSKQGVPQWVQAQVDDWTAFDSHLPITRQVKYLIMREVVKGLGGSDDLFHAPIND